MRKFRYASTASNKGTNRLLEFLPELTVSNPYPICQKMTLSTSPLNFGHQVDASFLGFRVRRCSGKLRATNFRIVFSVTLNCLASFGMLSPSKTSSPTCSFFESSFNPPVLPFGRPPTLPSFLARANPSLVRALVNSSSIMDAMEKALA